MLGVYFRVCEHGLDGPMPLVLALSLVELRGGNLPAGEKPTPNLGHRIAQHPFRGAGFSKPVGSAIKVGEAANNSCHNAECQTGKNPAGELTIFFDRVYRPGPTTGSFDAHQSCTGAGVQTRESFQRNLSV